MTGPRPPEPTREILNIEEAAQLLGVSTKTFAKVLREGEIPGRKIGREWKFSRKALIDWVARSSSRDFIDLADDPDEAGGADSDPVRTSALPSQVSRPHAPSPKSPPKSLTRRGDTEMSVEED